VRALGPEIYYAAWTWNAMHWGNVGFVYAGASMRIAFLSGVGLGGGVKGKKVVGEKMQKKRAVRRSSRSQIGA